MKARYDDEEVNVKKIVSALEQHQIQLLKDIATLDQLYEQNLNYFKELSMYIEAGKMRVAQVRETDLAQARARAQSSGLPEDAQAANDQAAKNDRFEKWRLRSGFCKTAISSWPKKSSPRWSTPSRCGRARW